MLEVSIVIPTRNRKALLARTLATVLWQRNVDLDVVVVDDCSTDGTPLMIEALADPRVKVVRQVKRSGVSAARNRGIDESTGEWVAFLDDDDLWAPDKLDKQLRSACSEGRGWAFSGEVAVNGDLVIVAGGKPATADEARRHMPLVNQIPAGASNVLVQRRLLDRAGRFDIRLRHLSDWDMWIRLAQLDTPAVVAEPLVAYLLHASNASTDAADAFDEMLLLERKYRSVRREPTVNRAAVHRWIAWNHLRRGNRLPALKAYARAVKCGDRRSVRTALLGMVWPNAAWRGLPWRRAHGWYERAAWIRDASTLDVSAISLASRSRPVQSAAG